MYKCSNCGVEFNGNVCPNCCTMRPAASVLGKTGGIHKQRGDSMLAPGQHAVKFARDLEESRRQDIRQQEKQMRALMKRRREEEKAAEAERLRKEEEARRASEEKAAAPQKQSDAERPFVPSAKNTPSVPPSAAKPAGSDEKRTVSDWVMQTRKVPSAGERSVQHKSMSSAGSSERIDAAWRAFAKGVSSEGKN